MDLEAAATADLEEGQAEHSIAGEEVDDGLVGAPIDLAAAVASYPREEALEVDHPIVAAEGVRIRPVAAAGRSYAVDCTTFDSDYTRARRRCGCIGVVIYAG